MQRKAFVLEVSPVRVQDKDLADGRRVHGDVAGDLGYEIMGPDRQMVYNHRDTNI